MQNELSKEISEAFFKESHEYVLSENSQKDPEYYGSGLHASSIGYCKRKAVLQAVGAKAKEQSLVTLMTFRMGNEVHKINLEFLKNSKSFEVLDSEVDISDGLPDIIKGKYDFRVLYKPKGMIILGDTKSAHPSQFRYYRGKLPHKHHITQLSCYAEACEKKDIPYDLLAIFYWDKGGTNQPQICFVEKDKNINAIMDDYLKALELYKSEGVLPDVDIKDLPFEKACEYCEYYEVSCNGVNNKKDNFYKYVKESSNE